MNHEGTARFTILTVCTGNVCRSPLAEHLLRKALRGWNEISVASAGTGALIGQPMTDPTIAIATELGVDTATAHTARALDIEHLRNANLVLALTRAHRSDTVAMLPRSSRHTFTLREYARLLDAIPAEDWATIAATPATDTVARLNELTDAAAALRGYVIPPEREEDDDVIDPYRRDDATYRQSASEMVPAINTIVRQLHRAATITA